MVSNWKLIGRRIEELNRIFVPSSRGTYHWPWAVLLCSRFKPKEAYNQMRNKSHGIVTNYKKSSNGSGQRRDNGEDIESHDQWGSVDLKIE